MAGVDTRDMNNYETLDFQKYECTSIRYVLLLISTRRKSKKSTLDMAFYDLLFLILLFVHV